MRLVTERSPDRIGLAATSHGEVLVTRREPRTARPRRQSLRHRRRHLRNRLLPTAPTQEDHHEEPRPPQAHRPKTVSRPRKARAASHRERSARASREPTRARARRRTLGQPRPNAGLQPAPTRARAASHRRRSARASCEPTGSHGPGAGRPSRAVSAGEHVTRAKRALRPQVSATNESAPAPGSREGCRAGHSGNHAHHRPAPKKAPDGREGSAPSCYRSGSPEGRWPNVGCSSTGAR